MLDRNNLHHYQERGVEHIIEKHKCALFLDLPILFRYTCVKT